MSKVFQSLIAVAVITFALVDSPRPSEARGLSARGGSSAFHVDANCWTPFGATVTNTCSTPKYWHVPLVADGSFNGWYYPSVTAQGFGSTSYVNCRVISTYKDGNLAFIGGWFNLPQFGVPADINLVGWAPAGGTLMIDCDVGPQGKVHTVNW